MTSYKSVADRNYQRYASAFSNIAYLHHPSGVSVIILKEIPQSEVIAVDFGSHKKHGVNRAANTVVGKGKKGGLQLQKETRLCTIRCKNGEEIIIRAGVRGTLAEVNSRLIENPDLVRTAPENQGFIAIVTYGAGKRKPDEFTTELPSKRVYLMQEQPEVPQPETLAELPNAESQQSELLKAESPKTESSHKTEAMISETETENDIAKEIENKDVSDEGSQSQSKSSE